MRTVVKLLAGAGVAAVAAGAASVATRYRWGHADDPTGGRALVLPEHDELTVVTSDGAQLAVSTMGDAGRPPIVLVHGWVGAQQEWATVARDLVAHGRRVVTFDQRGHGASTLGSEGTTMEAIAEDLKAVLEAVEAHDAVVVGHSMGGMGVQTFAVEHPDVLKERVAGLVLASTEAAEVVAGGPVVRRAGEVLVASRLSSWALDDRFLGPMFTRISVGRGVSLATLDATRQTWGTTPPAVRAGFLEGMSHLDLLDRLETIEVPTLIVAGTKDRLVLPSHIRDLATHIPGARLELLPGVGHQVMFEAPHRVASLIEELATSVTPFSAPSGDQS